MFPLQYTVSVFKLIPAPLVEKYKTPAVLPAHAVGLVSLNRANFIGIFVGITTEAASEPIGV